MSITVLGCSGGYPGAGEACSGYLVRGGGLSVWLEAGSGSLAQLQRHVSLDAVDAVVLTHEHPDHVSDIEGFHVACRYVLGREGVPVFAPASVRGHLYHAGSGRALAWHDVGDGDQVELSSLSLRFSRPDHGPETLAVRIEGQGGSLGYSADSGPGWSLEALGPGLDLALCEATLPQDEEGKVAGHMSARQAGASGRDAGVRRLVLTHLWPVIDADRSRREGSDAFGSDVDVARMHRRYEVW